MTPSFCRCWLRSAFQRAAGLIPAVPPASSRRLAGSSRRLAEQRRTRLTFDTLEHRLAPSITWTAPQNISGDSDVSTAGTLVDAWSIGATGVGNTIVNGVPFTGTAANGSSVSDGTYTLAVSSGSFLAFNNVGSGAAPFTNLSGAYQALLSNRAVVANPTTMTLTMSGLTAGHQYEFEWWTDKSDSSSAYTTTASDGNSVTLSNNTTGVAGGVGQFAIGTFTAVSGTEAVIFSPSMGVLLNGFQLRDVSPNQTFTVTSAADSGSGTLRQAIAEANGITGATINFAPGSKGQTIDLTSYVNNTGAAPPPPSAGPTAFDITSNMTIVGSGEVIQRDATASPFRLFTVEAGASLTLSGLSLEDGLAQGFNGGTSQAGGAGGGAAGLGGAVFNLGSLTIQDSTLTANTAQGGSGGNISGSNPGGAGGGGLGSVGVNAPGTGNGANGGGPNGGTGDTGSGAGIGGFGGGGGGGNLSTTPGATGGFGGGGGGGGGSGGAGSTGSSGGAGGFGAGGAGGGGGASGGGSFGAGGFGGGAGADGAGGSLGGAGGGGAGLGGAIFNAGGTLVLTNDTIFGNKALGGTGVNDGSGLGGGVFNLDGTLTATNDTLAGNTVSGSTTNPNPTDGGAFYSLQMSNTGIPGNPTTATLNLTNNIFANSTGGTNDFVNGGGGTLTAGTNLYTAGTAPSGFTQTTSTALGLGVLALNGGLTPTMAITTSSAAFNAGNNADIPPGRDHRPARSRLCTDCVRHRGRRRLQGAAAAAPPVAIASGHAESFRHRHRGRRRPRSRSSTPTPGRCCSTSSLTDRLHRRRARGRRRRQRRRRPGHHHRPRPRHAPEVKVFDGRTGALLRDFYAGFQSTRCSPAASSWPPAT